MKDIINKIYSINIIENQVVSWKYQNKKIVFTNGCFDILHLGHVEYLSKAKKLGDILIVGLNSDDSKYWLTKGPNRPINNQNSRAIILASLLFVDAVVFFSEDTPFELIKIINPDVIVKGKDYKEEDIVGYDFIKNTGGEVITIELTEGYSTTTILGKL